MGSVECPECGREFDTKRGFYSHWGHSDEPGHGGPTPDEIGRPEFTDEHRRRIAESKEGQEVPYETRRKISESLEGNTPWNKGLTKELDERLRKLSESLEGHEKSDEAIRKQAESLREAWREGAFDERDYTGSPGNTWGGRTDTHTVPETGHEVDSKWEVEIDRLFHTLGLDYEYEPRAFEFENGRSHTPDFIIDGRIAVEVKGFPVTDWHKERAELFMAEYPEYTYMIIGTTEVPADMAIRWDDRAFVEEVL